MSFYDSSIEAIHLEITDHCNASCGQCLRNIHGGKVNPYLPGQELSLDDVKKILPTHFVKQLKRLYMCGNYGDPIMAKDTLAVYEYLREQNEHMSLSMNTNGSARDTAWWRRLAHVINGRGNVKFGLDGLEDTHHIYRRGTNYQRILNNAHSFIEAGGNAIWEFIVFRHNEHQVEEARKLSEEMGFHKFVAKKTGRFFSNSRVEGNEKQEIRKSDGTFDYYIEKPRQEQYQNKSLLKEKAIVDKYGSMTSYLDQTDIKCKTAAEKSVYISSEGLIFPCCWTANQMYLWYMPAGKGQIWDLVHEYGGKASLCAKKRSIDDIINGDIFNRIKSSWSCASVEKGKLKTCAKTCGTLFDQFKDQYA